MSSASMMRAIMLNVFMPSAVMVSFIMLYVVYAESCMFSCFITVLIIIMVVVAMLSVMALVKEVFRSLHKNVIKYSPAQIILIILIQPSWDSTASNFYESVSQLYLFKQRRRSYNLR